MNLWLSSPIALTALPFLACGIIFAQVKLPDTPQGKMVREFVEAFNGGDEAQLRQFFLDNVSKEGLAERPAETRVERMIMFRSDAKSLALKKVLDAGPTTISVTAEAGSGEKLTLTFEFDPTPQHKFAGLGVEMGEQEPPGGPPISREELMKSVEDYLSESARDDKFSGAVLVEHDSVVVFKSAYGDADKRFRVPNSTDTKFNLGSINKFFTRLAIGQLAEAGKISFDTPIIAYLPDYPNKKVAEKVTVNQLLSMKSGMGDFFGDKFAGTAKDRVKTLDDYLQFFVNDTLLFEPGTQRRYSNAGFIVLGLIVERLTGGDYYSYVRDHIFKPAGMINSDWFPSEAVAANLARGYTHPEGGEHFWIENIHELPGRGSSAGGGYSTLEDLRNFIHALLEGKLLSPKYTEWMLSNSLPAADPPLPLRRGGMGMAGGTSGVNSVVDFDAASGTIVIVLGNYDPPAAEVVSKKISGLVKRVQWEK